MSKGAGLIRSTESDLAMVRFTAAMRGWNLAVDVWSACAVEPPVPALLSSLRGPMVGNARPDPDADP